MQNTRFNIFLPKMPIVVNELILVELEAAHLSLVNMLLKMFVYPLKSLTLIFNRQN